MDLEQSIMEHLFWVLNEVINQPYLALLFYIMHLMQVFIEH